MSQFRYKVLITTSGTGSRLGDLTKYINKALIRIGKKPVISYIIESYSKQVPFVITLGHFGKQIKDFVNIAYKDRKFEFVQVDKYEGEESSLGYSMLCAQKLLQCPFIYNASDTIVEDSVGQPDHNWIGGYIGEGSSNYASFNVLNGRIQEILGKGILNPDYLHIGLVGIRDYKSFWRELKKLCSKNRYGQELSDVHVLNAMLFQGIDFKIKEFKTWRDTGNIEPLRRAREQMSDSFNNLDKPKESIFIFNRSVIKFYYDSKMVKERIKRAKILKPMVPKITASSDNFFSYVFAKGDLYSEAANPKNFEYFLEWSKKNLWKPVKETSDAKFRQVCYDFYFNKTMDRVKEFLSTRGIKDSDSVINEQAVPTIKDLFKRIDFDWLCDAGQSNFHGDYVLDNIIKTKNGFCLLDWRNNFGGLLKAGDVYYDLAKINHNLIVNHNIIMRNLFTIKINGNDISCDILRKENLIECQKVLFDFLRENGYDVKKVKLLTCFIWLSSAPLHHKPYDHFLFYFGKLNLWRILNEK